MILCTATSADPPPDGRPLGLMSAAGLTARRAAWPRKSCRAQSGPPSDLPAGPDLRPPVQQTCAPMLFHRGGELAVIVTVLPGAGLPGPDRRRAVPAARAASRHRPRLSRRRPPAPSGVRRQSRSSRATDRRQEQRAVTRRCGVTAAASPESSLSRMVQRYFSLPSTRRAAKPTPKRSPPPTGMSVQGRGGRMAVLSFFSLDRDAARRAADRPHPSSFTTISCGTPSEVQRCERQFSLIVARICWRRFEKLSNRTTSTG